MAELLDDLSTHTMRRDGFALDELARELEALGPRWSVADGALQLALAGPMSHTGPAAAFIGALAEELGHEPRIVIERDGMTLALRTSDADADAAAVTVTDLLFAARVEQWLRAHGWPT